MEILFGGGFGPGGPGGAQIDPTLIENLFGPGYGGGGFGGDFPMGGAAAAPVETRNSAPPTSQATLRTLPRIKVSANDIEKNESNECSICLDELILGQPALRIPCGHLYHEDCVNDWLKKSNECPVCRFELPTDDAAYEGGRLERMAGRKIRLRHDDLAARSAGELKRLALFLKIDTKGCLEKSEFVERIAASSQVQIVEAADGATTTSSIFDYAMTGNGDVDMTSPIGEASGSMSRDLASAAGSGAMSSEQPPARSPFLDPSVEAAPSVPLARQGVGQLRQLAKQLGVSLDGCLEKSDIVQRIEASPSYRA